MTRSDSTRVRSAEVPRPSLPVPRPGPRSSSVPVPVRGTSVITGLERACSAELVGFASPIGRLSAILRISDEITGETVTSVVPVGFPERTEGAPRTVRMIVPPSDVRARDLRVQTEDVRLLVRIPAGTVLAELLAVDFDGTSARRQALVLTTALRGGALVRT